MRVLVVGGAGYIGSHAIRQLRRAGFDPVVFDNFSTGFRQLAAGWPVIEGDIRNYDDIRAALEGFTIVMHFAAHAYIGESVENPRKYYHNNVIGGITLLDAAIDAGVKQFIFSSTCATYGVPESMPILESTPQRPVSPYGASKLIFERILSDYGAAYGLRSVALRYFNAAGGDEAGEVGELHNPETHLIPRVLQVADGTLHHLDVFGDDYPTPDGTCIRDYIHVTDLADAHVLALQYLREGGASTAVNLGTGTGHSVKKVIQVAEESTGRKVKVEIGPRRSGDPHMLVASAVRAERLFGWKAKRGLREIVDSAWAWMRKQPAH